MATGGASSGDEDSSSEFSDLDDDAYLFTTDDTEYDWMMAQQLQELGDALPDIETASGTSGSKFDTNSKGAKNEKAKVLEDESSSVTETEIPKKLIQRIPKIKSTLHSKKLTAEILAKTHKVEMVTAQAAVESQGCDLELCLQWIERNRFNSTLLNEKLMEFRWSCGLATELEMMEWTVKTLVTNYGVAKDLAMAVTILIGCQNLKNCKRFAMTGDLSTSDVDEALAAYKQRIELLRNVATAGPESKSTENQRDDLFGFRTELKTMDLTVKNLVTSCGIADNLAMAVTLIKGYQNFEECKQFALSNDLGASKVDQAVIAYQKRREWLSNLATIEMQTKMWTEIWRADISGLSFSEILYLHGIQSPLVDKMCQFLHLTGWKTCFEWVLRNQYDDGKLDLDTSFNPDKDLEWWFCNEVEGFEKGQVEKGLWKISSFEAFFCQSSQANSFIKKDIAQIEAISMKNAAAKLLSDFFPSRVAKAAVEANSINISLTGDNCPTIDVDKCREWADQHLHDERMIQRLSSSFDEMPQGQRLDEFIALTCRRILSCERPFIGRWSLNPCGRWLHGAPQQIFPTFKYDRVDINAGRWMLSRCHSGFLKKIMLKAKKAQTVGVEGGKITLEECSISFPEGALTGDTDFEMTLDNNPDSFPDICIPVTPIIGCRPHISFLRPVTVEMTTCYSAIDDAKISASLYQRREATTDWGEIKEVMIGSKNVVQFDVMHFSDDIVGVSEDSGGQGEFHLINDVYIKKDTGTVSSMFFVDQSAHAAATTAMKQRGVYPLLMAPKEIIAKMNTEMKLTMQCRKPQGTTVVNCTDPPNVKITPQFLKKRGHQLYFELEPELGNFNGTLSIRYKIKIDEEGEDMLPLTTNWPIVADSPASVVNVDARTTMRANVITTGNATTFIENHDPVTTMDTD